MHELGLIADERGDQGEATRWHLQVVEHGEFAAPDSMLWLAADQLKRGERTEAVAWLHRAAATDNPRVAKAARALLEKFSDLLGE